MLTLFDTGLVGLALFAVVSHSLRHGLSPLLWFNAPFLVIILPKIAYLDSWFRSGRSSFVFGHVAFDALDLSRASGLVAAFVAVLNLSYGPRPIARLLDTRQLEVAYGARSLARACWYLLLPVSLVALLVCVVVFDIGLDSLSAKRTISLQGATGVVGWIAWKTTGLSRTCVYLSFILLRTSERHSRLARRVFVASLGLTVLTQVLFSQRSSLVLIAFDLVLFVNVQRPVRMVSVLRLSIVLLAVNTLVIYFRSANGTIAELASATFLRLYFFDPVKVGGIARYVDGGRSVPPQLDTLSTFGSTPLPDVSLHFAIGEAVFGVRSGVPPSLPGEVLLSLGGLLLVPLCVGLGLAMRTLYGRAGRTTSALSSLVLIMVTNRIGYFAATSDMEGAALRILQDLVLLRAGVMTIRLLTVRKASRSAVNLPAGLGISPPRGSISTT